MTPFRFECGSRPRGRVLLSAVLLIVAALTLAVRASASELGDDLAARRQRVMERLGPEAMLILWSAPTRVYSRDIDYEYRQESNFYYLTGIEQDGSTLVLMPGNTTNREILFIRENNATREHWEGRSLTTEGAAASSGIRTVMQERDFEPFVAAMLGRRGYSRVSSRDAKAFADAVGAGHAKVALLLESSTVTAPLTAPMEFARQLRDRFSGFESMDANPILTDLRTVKTPYEQKVLAKSVEISSEALVAGMKATRPGAFEYEVKAAVEGGQRGRGAMSPAYPSIIGSGPNTTILHYPEDDRQMQTGDLLLADAGANYHYMSADVTRTYPVSGTFTPAQKDLYALVRQAQEAGEQAAVAGASLAMIHDKTVEVMKAGLLKLGLITDTSGDQYAMWYTHTAGHYIGIDVHDPGDRTRALVPGMAFTIEPGLYIRQSAIDNLPRNAANTALIEKIQGAVTKYIDTGIRIEDSYVLEAGGVRRLSVAVPREIDEIEGLMRGRP